ncbi:MAG: hypothetical protein ACYS80_16345 [Planctomycetota bacterium]|jgi:hypothetical protein
MTNNLNQFGGQGARFAFWALWDSAQANYIAGTDGSLTSGEDSGMGRLLGISDFTATTPDAPIIPRPGDNALLGTFITNPTSSPQGNDAFASFDQLFDTSVTNRLIHAEGPHDISLSSSRCYEYSPLFLVINSPGMSDEAATKGEAGWIVEEYLYVFAQPTSVASKSINTAHSYTHKLAFNERGVLPYGEAITAVKYGLTEAWKTDPYWSTHPVYYHTYVGDGGAAQTFTLDKIPYAQDGTALQIWEAGTKLVYTTNYSVDTSGVVTFVGTDPAASAFAVCKVLYTPDC